jgi:hypothetical protein
VGARPPSQTGSTTQTAGPSKGKRRARTEKEQREWEVQLEEVQMERARAEIRASIADAVVRELKRREKELLELR